MIRNSEFTGQTYKCNFAQTEETLQRIRTLIGCSISVNEWKLNDDDFTQGEVDKELKGFIKRAKKLITELEKNL